MTHDFKKAFEWCDKIEILAKSINASHEFVENVPTIRLALKLADRLMGEPSEAMRMAAYDEWQNGKDAWSQLLAMRDQLLKECVE